MGFFLNRKILYFIHISIFVFLFIILRDSRPDFVSEKLFCDFHTIYRKTLILKIFF